MKLQASWLGRISYGAASEQMNIQMDSVRGTREIQVLGFEPESVITLGRRAQVDRDLHVLPESLKQSGIDLVKVDRGGQATWHGPGQLVIFPLADLTQQKMGVREFVNLLTNTTAETLRQFEVITQKNCGEPGVFTEQGKIAFIGIRVSRGVTSHGVSLNISPDLANFDLIRSCGIEARRHDSLKRWGAQVSPLKVFERWSANLDRMARPMF
jgi:lipoate-protein ligase B